VDAGPEIREELGLRVQVEDAAGNRADWARGLVLDGTTIGQFVTYALSLPLIASLTGHALRLLARSSTSLSNFLALPQPTDYLHLPRPYELTPYLAPSLSTSMLGLQAARMARGMDPVWWRNAVGLCLFTGMKDAVGLLHAWLRREEKRSRKIVSRDFGGVDLAGLDLIL
jgi:hypothetical protein